MPSVEHNTHVQTAAVQNRDLRHREVTETDAGPFCSCSVPAKPAGIIKWSAE